MSENITVKNVLEWMSCDRDIQRFEGVTLKNLWKVLHAQESLSSLKIVKKRDSVLRVFTDEKCLRTVMGFMNSFDVDSKVSEKHYGSNYNRSLLGSYSRLYDSSSAPVDASYGRYITDMIEMVDDIISQFGEHLPPDITDFGCYLHIDSLSFFNEACMDNKQYFALLRSESFNSVSLLNDDLLTQLSNHFENSIEKLMGEFSSEEKSLKGFYFLKYLLRESIDDSSYIAMNYTASEYDEPVRFSERKIAFDMVFAYVFLKLMLKQISDNEAMNNIDTRKYELSSPLQYLIEDDFDIPFSRVIRLQKELMVKVIMYCTLLNMSAGKKGSSGMTEIIEAMSAYAEWIDTHPSRFESKIIDMVEAYKVKKWEKVGLMDMLYKHSDLYEKNVINMKNKREVKRFFDLRYMK
ncbi:TPA: hypothetical protein SCR70_001777 [Enterobacter kobei]|nr:hypothetical protein [Enterobacter kobei]